MTDANTLKRNTAWLSIMSNTLLVILKLAVGLYVGAVSLVSEALNSCFYCFLGCAQSCSTPR